jgi:CubicO group peptidase (beta-lactamase class C family)
MENVLIVMKESKIKHSLIIFVLIICIAGSSFGINKEKVVWPEPKWGRARPEDVGMDTSILLKGRDYALTGDGSGCIIRYGQLVAQWGDQSQRYDLKSTTKAIGVTALGLALKDHKIESINDLAKKYHTKFGTPPESNTESGWLDKITLFDLATQTAGFDKNGGYTKLMFEPGTKWSYSDGGPNWLAECITLVYGQDLNELMFERVFGLIGITKNDLTWRNNAYRPREIDGIKRREFGSGISANVDAMARIGYLYLRGGRWKDKQIIPTWFVDMARTVPRAVRGLEVLKKEAYFNASDHYGLLWWNNTDGTMANVPRDTYWSWGLYDSLIVVIPSLDIVAARAGKTLNKERNSSYSSIEPFIEPIALSATHQGDMASAPYPESPVINDIEWSPVETIIRLASGSDNWPITWADDNNQYAAYGDGWGFKPKTKKKLSLGIAKITGTPPDCQGINIRTETGERAGQGAKGAKASGMICINGVLYMLVRNTGNSQIAWSDDHGKTWTWCDWKFMQSFGYPTFLNFGKDYAGARDNFVYIYSHDSDGAYEPADRFVMARVQKNRILMREAYEFFQCPDESGQAIWTKDIHEMRAVFINPGSCYRSGISYNAGLKRYLWCQILPFSKDERGPRFQGGFGIYDAPEPWGPWTTVYYKQQWDVGPGETSCLPTKWMSTDGRTCYLLFSGDDCFSIRKATFHISKN